MARHGKLPNTKVNYGGVERTLYEWAQVAGIPWDLVRVRYSRGKRNYADLFAKSRDYTSESPTYNYDNTKYAQAYKERRKNMTKRVEALESKVERLREIVLEIAGKLNA